MSGIGPEITEAERVALEQENQLAGLTEHPGWPLFKDRLVGMVSDAFEAFLDADPGLLLEYRGEARALIRVLQEVDLGPSRRNRILEAVRARHEAAVQEEKSILENRGAPAWTRGRRPPVPF